MGQVISEADFRSGWVLQENVPKLGLPSDYNAHLRGGCHNQEMKVDMLLTRGDVTVCK